MSRFVRDRREDRRLEVFVPKPSFTFDALPLPRRALLFCTSLFIALSVISPTA